MLVSERAGTRSRTIDGVDAAILAVGIDDVVRINGCRIDTPLKTIVVIRVGSRVLELPLRCQGGYTADHRPVRGRQLSHVVRTLWSHWAERRAVAVRACVVVVVFDDREGAVGRYRGR